MKRKAPVTAISLLLSSFVYSASPTPGVPVWEIALNDLDKIGTIESKTEAIQQNTLMVQSIVDTLSSASLSEEILTKLCSADSKIEQLCSDLASDTDTLQMAIMIAKECVITIDSKIDVLDNFIEGSVESKLCVIDSKVDNVGDQVELLQLTMNTIESRVSILSESKLDDMICDTPKLHAINSKVEKIVDDLRCTPTVLTEAGTISIPGSYCLANDVAGTITIDAPRVNLDLNGKQVLGTISLTSNANITSIFNGIIDGNGGSGIERFPIGPAISDLVIFDVTIVNALDGLILNFVSNVFIRNVKVFGSASDNATIFGCDKVVIEDSVFNDDLIAAGLLMSGCSDIKIRRCIANNNVSVGIFLSVCDRSVIEDCNCNNHTTFPGSTGVSVDGGSCHRLVNVTASSNRTGFFLGASNLVCTNCVACANGDPMDMMSAGFSIGGPSATNVCVKNCVAKNNRVGFRTGMSTSGILQDNVALDNLVCGFEDDTSAFPSPFAYVGNAAFRNGAGFALGNYCADGSPTAPESPPFDQVLSFDAVSSWNNISA